MSQLEWINQQIAKLDAQIANLSAELHAAKDKDVKASIREEMNALQKQRKIMETKRENVKE